MPARSLRACAGAFAFLTGIPIGRAFALDADDVARGAVVFPLVGAAIGAATAASALLLHPTVPTLLAAALGVGVAAVLTGALHFDALADTVDALGAPSRERALEVMRDPRLGSFGAVALVVDVVVKIAAVEALLGADELLYPLVCAGALSRAASPVLAAALPYPRVGGGPGSVLSGRVSSRAAVVGGLAAVAATVGLLGGDGVIVVGTATALVVALAFFYRRWLGGATGDCLGTATEVSETLALVVAAALV
jgi:adenosylcobinamide-GDP ribazoletransferase